jgi:hypothetical protein
MLARMYPWMLLAVFALAFLDAEFDVGAMERLGLDIYFQAFTYEMTHYDTAQTHLARPLTTYETSVSSSYLTAAGTEHGFTLNGLPFHFLLVPFLNDFERRMTDPPSLQLGRYLCGALGRHVGEPLKKISLDVNAGEHLRYYVECAR